MPPVPPMSSVAYTALTFMGVAGIVAFLRFFFVLGSGSARLERVINDFGKLSDMVSEIRDRLTTVEALVKGSEAFGPEYVGQYDRRSGVRADVERAKAAIRSSASLSLKQVED